MNKIIITGASSDIGCELIKQIAEDNNYDGSLLFCQYHSNSEKLEEFKRNYTNLNFELNKCDLSKNEEISNWINTIKENNIPSHIIHLAADKFEYMRIKDMDIERFKKTIDIQLYSIVRIISEFLPLMAKQKQGKVVMMLTAYTLGVPPKYMSNYITAKYALEGFMKATASEYAGKGVSINAVSPNMMETKFLSNLDERIVEMNANNSSMKRNIRVDEVASSIMYLMSDRANYINGINLNLSGGDYM